MRPEFDPSLYELVDDDPPVPMLIRAVRPYPFKCRLCGCAYESVWVQQNSITRLCQPCIIKEKAKLGCLPAETYDMPPIYRRDGSSLLPVLAKWVASPLPALAILLGGPGRGKTAQVHHAAAAFAKRGRKVRVIGDRDLMRADDGAFHAITTVPFLAIDEIGRRSSENSLANVCEILDQRIAYDRKTLLVTNLDGAGLNALDARLFSRLKTALPVPFSGPDLRARPMDGRP